MVKGVTYGEAAGLGEEAVAEAREEGGAPAENNLFDQYGQVLTSV